MAEDAQVAQAQLLLATMQRHLTEISAKLEAVERRGRRESTRGALNDRRHESALRRDLYEANRLISGLHRRFPELSVTEAVASQ